MEKLAGLTRNVFACVLTAFLVSCGTKYVIVPETHYKDSIRVIEKRDSIRVHDSVWVSEVVRGDTVYKDRVTVRYEYRDRLLVDTLLVTRTDTLRVSSPTGSSSIISVRSRKWFVFVALMAVAALICGIIHSVRKRLT